MTQEKNNLFGIFLRQGMHNGNFTQAELSEKCGVSQGTISRYLNGKASPKADELLRISKVLGVTMEWLLTGQGDDQQRIDPIPIKSIRAEVKKLAESLEVADDSVRKLTKFFGL